MKLRICVCLMLSYAFFSSCQKSGITPAITQTQDNPKAITTIPLNAGTGSSDSVYNNVKGYLRLQLAKDSINTDNIMIVFNPAAKTSYYGGEDAPALQGFGLESLASFSSNNIALAINAEPLTKKGLTISLRVAAKEDGIYKLQMLTIESLPAAYDIWLKDSFKKDSLSFRDNASYAFNIYKKDTTSFGSHRFKLVIRPR
ncbi:MAG: hypothetical protein ACXVB0_15155 [Mucilaginibacter sp.]